ncbi:MAG: hypothetical protein AAFP22_05625, partial [Planctomycetota bacterium]
MDPGLDLTDDSATGLPDYGTGCPWDGDCGAGCGEDCYDIIYLACGHLGLWAMEAHPGAAHTNVAVRLDDSGNRNPATQGSQRFC